MVVLAADADQVEKYHRICLENNDRYQLQSDTDVIQTAAADLFLRESETRKVSRVPPAPS